MALIQVQAVFRELVLEQILVPTRELVHPPPPKAPARQ